MAETDPSIILDVNQNPGIQPSNLISMFDFAQKAQQYRQQQAGRNALLGVLSNPDSIDPNTGLPTTKAIGQVTRIDPTAGIQLQNETLDAQVKRAQQEHLKTEAGKQNWDFMTSAAGIGVNAYDEAKKSGKSDDEARAAGQEARNDAVKNNGGVIGDDVADGIISKPFDPMSARALAKANSEYTASQHDATINRVADINAGLPDPDAPPAAQAASADPYDALAAKIDKSENSTGDRSAQSGTSSATGNGQFTSSTWLDNVKAERPELVKAGLTDNQILALRNDPAFSSEMTVSNAKKNAGLLSDAGMPVTGATVAAAHKLGPADAQKVIAADPTTPLRKILSPEVIKANPQLANQTAGQYMGAMTSQFGSAPLKGADDAAAPQKITGGKGWQERQDLDSGTTIRYNPQRGIATDLSGNVIPTPKRLGNVPSGQARSAPAMYMQRFLADHPDASPQDVANAMADYQRTQVAGTADVKAEAAGLQNLGKMKSSVEQAEGNAKKEADLVLSLADKGTVNGVPQAFNSWVQSARKGVFNSPDVTKFQTAVESFKNEYVKVLSTTGGMSGGMSSDAARREADAYINPNLTLEQIKGNIAVMKKSMANRTAAINDAYDDTKKRVTTAGGAEGDSAQAPPPSKILHYDAQGNLVNSP